MPLVKIIVDYDNADGWKSGDIVDCTNPWTLLKEGKVMLVNDKGNEIPLPDVVLTCPTCIYKTSKVKDLIIHLFSHLSIQDKIEITKSMSEPIGSDIKEEKEEKVEEVVSPTTVEKVEKPFADMTPEEKKAWRIENLKKAREARGKKENG